MAHLLRAIGTLTLALPVILLPGCATAPAAATRAPERTGKPAPATNRPDQEPGAPASGKAGMPNLTPFWKSLFSASRYPGLRYEKVRRATMGPATAPASSTQVQAALKTHVR